jgi:hypothetical protein
VNPPLRTGYEQDRATDEIEEAPEWDPRPSEHQIASIDVSVPPTEGEDKQSIQQTTEISGGSCSCRSSSDDGSCGCRSHSTHDSATTPGSKKSQKHKSSKKIHKHKSNKKKCKDSDCALIEPSSTSEESKKTHKHKLSKKKRKKKGHHDDSSEGGRNESSTTTGSNNDHSLLCDDFCASLSSMEHTSDEKDGDTSDQDVYQEDKEDEGAAAFQTLPHSLVPDQTYDMEDNDDTTTRSLEDALHLYIATGTHTTTTTTKQNRSTTLSSSSQQRWNTAVHHHSPPADIIDTGLVVPK